MPHEYPMMLDVRDRLVVIIGGGEVALRKAVGLIECGGKRIRCVAPEFDLGLPLGVERVQERYEPRHLDGAGLVFAATDDPAVNAAVVRDARARGVLVNRADAGDEEPGDFNVPARLRLSGVTVTVSAGSPALSVMIRDGLAYQWDERWSRMAEAMQTLRPMILARTDIPQDRRRAMLRDLASPEALDYLAIGKDFALKRWLVDRYPELKHA
jgi:precorrin-2 dehydrogenase/sirohydrochlorin ferrochelatase